MACWGASTPTSLRPSIAGATCSSSAAASAAAVASRPSPPGSRPCRLRLAPAKVDSSSTCRAEGRAGSGSNGRRQGSPTSCAVPVTPPKEEPPPPRAKPASRCAGKAPRVAPSTPVSPPSPAASLWVSGPGPRSGRAAAGPPPPAAAAQQWVWVGLGGEGGLWVGVVGWGGWDAGEWWAEDGVCMWAGGWDGERGG